MTYRRNYSKYRDAEYHAIVDEHGYFPVRCPMTRREQLVSDIEFYSSYKAKSEWHTARIKRKLSQALLALARLNSKGDLR